MRTITSLEAWEADAARPPTVVTVGNFDGVHRAHSALLRALCRDAAEQGGEAVVVTFEPHPGRILHPATAPRLITPLEEKLRLLAASGVNAVLLLPFSRDLSLLSALAFVERVLVRGLRARAVHEGENFRFGHRQEGTAALLSELGREFRFEVRLHPDVLVRGAPVSSSRIRALIARGAAGQARHLLGRWFGIRGRLAAGRGVGRQRTVPTLNLQHYDELLPAQGVYCTRVELDGAGYAALTNVGVRPTFGEGGPLTVESHLLHPPAGLESRLGAELEVRFMARLRDERRFDSPEALRRQIEADIALGERYDRRIRATMDAGGIHA
ncbi:MAG: riboflavin biosynthesis protein RibF [Terriglobales bacterium]